VSLIIIFGTLSFATLVGRRTADLVGEQAGELQSWVEQLVEAVGVDDAVIALRRDQRRLAAVDGRPDAEHNHAEPRVAPRRVRLGARPVSVDRGAGRAHQQDGGPR